MRIDVFMIVTVRQIAELPLKPLATCIFAARLTPAVASPIAERFYEGFEQRGLSEHAAAFAQGDVVGRIETHGGEIAERAHLPAAVGTPHRVAAILDQPQTVPA